MSMSRLTKKDDSGNWSLKGLPWKDTYVGQVITRNTEEKIYGALCKLRDYEESGLDPKQVQQLKERDTAKKPIKTTEETGIRYTDSYRCLNCGGNFTGTGIAKLYSCCDNQERFTHEVLTINTNKMSELLEEVFVEEGLLEVK